jgi:hypothetical protein
MLEKWGRRLFTAGAVWLLLLGLVHSLSLIGKPQPANETERQLLDLMSNYKFNLMGSMRSMDNLVRGFSISFMLGSLVLGALDWTLRRERAELLKRVAVVNAVWLAAMTAVSFRYFFAVPASFLAIALVIFTLASITLPARARPESSPPGFPDQTL